METNPAGSSEYMIINERNETYSGNSINIEHVRLPLKNIVKGPFFKIRDLEVHWIVPHKDGISPVI